MPGQRTLVCYGDSNTHGTMPMDELEDMGRFAPDERWPGVLGARLGSGWRVIEEGLPGRTTVHPDPVAGEHKNGLAVLPAVLESHRPIDLLVLMLGTNDLKHRFQVPAVEIAESLARLLAVAKNSGTGPGGSSPQILLVCPPPVIETGCLAEIFEGAAAKADALAGYCAKTAHGHGAAFLDAGGVISSSPVDGVHFDAAAHLALGMAVAGTVAGMMK
jgi:lysophospholipase L1-like esterase